MSNRLFMNLNLLTFDLNDIDISSIRHDGHEHFTVKVSVASTTIWKCMHEYTYTGCREKKVIQI